MRVELGATWIDPEELAYPAGSLRQSRRKGKVRFPDGKLRIVTLGVPDTYSTIPARAARSVDGHQHGFVTVSWDVVKPEFVFRRKGGQ